jgi:hypothetical protein
MNEQDYRGHFAPPVNVIQAARAVMGAIDLDPFSTPLNNRLVTAARIYNCEMIHIDDILHRNWQCGDQQRVFLGTPTGATLSRRLLNKTLREYRDGRITQAVLWIAMHESMIRHPWIWDFPVCIPYRRLRASWYDDEFDRWQPVNAATWSFVVYLPPATPNTEFLAKLSRFSVAFSPIGRVVFNEFSGEDDWLDSFRLSMKKPYDFRG